MRHAPCTVGHGTARGAGPVPNSVIFAAALALARLAHFAPETEGRAVNFSRCALVITGLSRPVCAGRFESSWRVSSALGAGRMPAQRPGPFAGAKQQRPPQLADLQSNGCAGPSGAAAAPKYATPLSQRHVLYQRCLRSIADLRCMCYCLLSQ